jgi:putative aldouronate transport system substrate-binding protein
VESIKVLELMNIDKEFNNLLNYGVQGTHWEFVDESAGVISTIEGSGYAPNMQWALQNQFNTYLFPTEDPQKWEKYQAFNDSARLSATLGFTADQSNVRTQLASISNVKDQYDVLLKRGLVDPNEVRAEFMDALDAAGVDDVEAEMTRQVREWMASQ